MYPLRSKRQWLQDLRDSEIRRCGPADAAVCCHGLDWGCAPLRAWQDGQASSDNRHSRRQTQKSPIRRCFKPRTPLSAGIAGFASGCRSHEQESEVTFLGGCPASCPDAHRSTHGHRHVRNRALTAIIQLNEESTIYRVRAHSHPPRGECERMRVIAWTGSKFVTEKGWLSAPTHS